MSKYEQLDSGIIIPYNVIQTSGYRADAWTNDLTGQGMPGVDSSLNTTFSSFGTILAKQTLEALYKSDWLSRKICLRPAKDATRKFVQCKDQDTHKLVDQKFKDLKVKQKTKTGISWGRLFGGAGVVLITNDPDPTQPIKCNGEDKLVDLEVYDRHELTPVAYDVDYNSSNYMKPVIYQNRYGKQFHYSRIGFFTGAELTHDEMIANYYWGGSVVESVWQAIKNLQSTYDDVRFILSELNIGILKIPQLTEKSIKKDPREVVQRRVNAFNGTKSNQRVAAIDKEEEFSFTNRTVTGVNDLMEQFKGAAAGASEMGSLVLFGESPSGLNASQEEQLSTYYDMVSDIQQDQIAPFIDLVLGASGFEGVEWHFESLYEMSDKDKAQVMQQSSQAVAALMMAGLTPEEALKQLNSLSVWSIDIDEDMPRVE